VRQELEGRNGQVTDAVSQMEQRLVAATQKLARVQATVSRAERQRQNLQGSAQIQADQHQHDLAVKDERITRLEKNNHVSCA